jgi:hypothetical protein
MGKYAKMSWASCQFSRDSKSRPWKGGIFRLLSSCYSNLNNWRRKRERIPKTSPAPPRDTELDGQAFRRADVQTPCGMALVSMRITCSTLST